MSLRSPLAAIWPRCRRGSLSPRARRTAIRRACCETLESRRMLSFAPAVSYPTGSNPQGIVTADLNGDGKLDLATANAGSKTVSVLLGNGNGTFQPRVDTSLAGTEPLALAVGDLGGDGKMD